MKKILEEKIIEIKSKEKECCENLKKELFYLINEVNELGLTCGYIRIIDVCNMISKKFFSKNYENFLTESLK